jgi:hypothetical protein
MSFVLQTLELFVLVAVFAVPLGLGLRAWDKRRGN